jgi:hypothetical protein
MDAQGYYQSVEDAINKSAAVAGMDPAHWRAVASIESSINPQSNRYEGTQFKGLFQLGNAVWHDHGGGDIYNPMDNAMAAARYARANSNIFRAQFGRDPTPTEIYLMHQQGPGFYTKGTMSNIAGNPYAKGMVASEQTPQSFEAGWSKNLEAKAAAGGGTITPYQQSVAGTRGGGGGMPAGAAAGPAASTETPDGDTTGGLGAGLAAVQDRIAKQDQANQPPPLQPMQMAQPMMTPAMYRARLMAQAMLNRDMGITPPETPS